MQDSIRPQRLIRLPRTRLLGAAALMSGVLAAGCGGSSGSPTTTTMGGSTTSKSQAASAGAGTASGSSTATARRPASTGSTPPGALAFAKCMRASGAADFPDPSPGGGFVFYASAGMIASPAFRAAQAKCQKLLPNRGAGPAFSEQALVQLRKIAQCMRQRGISEFPDPRTASPTSVPVLGSASSLITDYRGVVLEFPATLNRQSPAYERAAAACGATFLGARH